MNTVGLYPSTDIIPAKEEMQENPAGEGSRPKDLHSVSRIANASCIIIDLSLVRCLTLTIPKEKIESD